MPKKIELESLAIIACKYIYDPLTIARGEKLLDAYAWVVGVANQANFDICPVDSFSSSLDLLCTNGGPLESLHGESR